LAVSTPIFATKASFCRMFRDLHDFSFLARSKLRFRNFPFFFSLVFHKPARVSFQDGQALFVDFEMSLKFQENCLEFGRI
jgi:hypothetical protein